MVPSRQEPSLRTPALLAWVICAFAAVASGAGLFVGGLYRDNAWVIPQNRGTDLVTLAVAVPVLILAARLAARGSARASIVWFGVLGYLWYVYAGASFAYALNMAFLLYVALFSLCMAALIALATRLDVDAVWGHFDAGTPVRPVALYLLFVALMLLVLWLGQLVPFFSSGVLPESVTLAGGQTMFVYVLDLGVVVPMAVLGSVWLWQRRPWGPLLGGFVLVKVATMGMALLSMTWFMIRAGQPVDVTLSVVWVFLAVSGIATAVWFLRHCR